MSTELTGPSAASRRRRRDALICIALALMSFVVFNANLRSIPAADTYAARYLPLSIWHNHTVLLDPIAADVAQGRDAGSKNAFWMRKGIGGHLVSLYPVVTPVVVAPLYLPVALYLDQVEWDPQQVDHLARIMEKLVASLIAAVSVSLVYILLRRRVEVDTAVLLSVAYAFGTTTWVISGQALWMHGLAAVFVAAAMLMVTGPPAPARVVLAGFFCAMIVCNRQPDAVLAAAIGLYALRWSGRKVPLLLLGGLVPLGLTLAYNIISVGSLVGAYGLLSDKAKAVFLDVSPLEGVLGLLFSPMRGLFVFSPFLLFLPFLLPRILREGGTRALTILLTVGVTTQIVAYGFGDWRQGVSWGPRWLTDMLPILMWLLAPGIAGLARGGRLLFGTAVGVSVVIQAVGAFWYTGASDEVLFESNGPEKLRPAWEIQNTPYLALLARPPLADLLIDVRGRIDTTRVVPAADGTQLQVEGWALAGSSTPMDVAIFVDGSEMGKSEQFFARGDIVQALDAPSPSGWRVHIPVAGLEPGKHTVAALVRTGPHAEQQLLGEVNFVFDPLADPDGLAYAAHRAVEWIGARQQPEGYWLTDFTASTSFQHVGEEMNTYTQATLIDVAEPIADQVGLTDALDRAKQFLGAQIEDGGLVRYHGRPDSPIIGRLGCAITPDADDTALAWRLVPGSREELEAALATLSEYRRPDGLYRTWLAPQEKYECIDPGSDPNPADIGIQINVLLLLAEVDRPAADALCAALRDHLSGDDAWVYYRVAPAMVAFRRPFLERAGCPLEFPKARMRTGDTGQDRWMDVITSLQRIERGDTESAIETARSLLRLLAVDDFASLRGDPPMVYHNDLTASVSRFYWSQDVGFALWLRLYHATCDSDPTTCAGI
jgi:hypothetical protein